MAEVQQVPLQTETESSPPSPTHWRDVARLFPSFSLQQVLQALTGFLIVRLLLPEQYGVWSLFALVLFYAMQLHLGAINLMHREVPFLIGQKDYARARQVESIAFSTSLTNCTIAAFLVIAVWLVWRPRTVTLFQIVLLGLFIVFQELFTYVNYWLRAYQRFKSLSLFLTTFACANLIAVALLAWWKQLTGVLLGYVISNGVVSSYFIAREKVTVHLRPAWPQNWHRLRQAAQLLLWTMMFIFLTTLDRLFISYRLGVLTLGFFGISLLISNFLYNSADVVLQVLFPKANAIMGSTGIAGDVGRLLLNSAETLSYILSAVLGLGFLLLPVVIPFLLPRYEPGIPAARIICLGLAWLVLAQLISVAYIALGKVQLCLLLQLLVLVVKAALLFMVHSPHLTTVSTISNVANLVYLLVVVFANPVTDWRPFNAISRLAVPWVLVGSALWLAEVAHPLLSRPFGQALVISGIYLVVIIPLLWAFHQFLRRLAHV